MINVEGYGLSLVTKIIFQGIYLCQWFKAKFYGYSFRLCFNVNFKVNFNVKI